MVSLVNLGIAMKLNKIFCGMVVVLNELPDATKYRVHAINESIVTLSYINNGGRKVYTETHHTLIQAPTKEQLECV